MLIVEGLDNTGKTTLVQWISEEYPQFEVQQSIGNNHDLRMIRLQAHDESSLNRPLLLCDRSRLISEYVYNPVLKSRPIAYDLRDWLNMIGGFLTRPHLVIWMQRPMVDLLRTFDQRDQLGGVYERIPELETQYKMTMAMLGFFFLHANNGSAILQWELSLNLNDLKPFIDIYLEAAL